MLLRALFLLVVGWGCVRAQFNALFNEARSLDCIIEFSPNIAMSSDISREIFEAATRSNPDIPVI